MKQDFDFLREKGNKFYEAAKADFEKENYDMSAFHLEQAVQLYLKHTVGRIVGDFPRIHDLEELLEMLCETTESNTIRSIVNTNRKIIKDIYKSYFETRYYNSPYSKEQLDEMFLFTERLIKSLKELWN